jgi:uncharacterized protein (DUF433 family)
MTLKEIVHSDPDMLGGTPVFVGTRVPVRILLDYLEGGEPLEEFLDNYPSVTREQAVGFLEEDVADTRLVHLHALVPQLRAANFQLTLPGPPQPAPTGFPSTRQQPDRHRR